MYFHPQKQEVGTRARIQPGGHRQSWRFPVQAESTPTEIGILNLQFRQKIVIFRGFHFSRRLFPQNWTSKHPAIRMGNIPWFMRIMRKSRKWQRSFEVKAVFNSLHETFSLWFDVDVSVPGRHPDYDYRCFLYIPSICFSDFPSGWPCFWWYTL